MTFDLGVVEHYHLHHVKYAAAKFEVATSNANTLFDLYLGVKVTQNVAQYSPHNVIYAPAKFEVTGCFLH